MKSFDETEKNEATTAEVEKLYDLLQKLYKETDCKESIPSHLAVVFFVLLKTFCISWNVYLYVFIYLQVIQFATLSLCCIQSLSVKQWKISSTPPFSFEWVLIRFQGSIVFAPEQIRYEIILFLWHLVVYICSICFGIYIVWNIHIFLILGLNFC